MAAAAAAASSAAAACSAAASTASARGGELSVYMATLKVGKEIAENERRFRNVVRARYYSEKTLVSVLLTINWLAALVIIAVYFIVILWYNFVFEGSREGKCHDPWPLIPAGPA